jgi:hypothetical protein
MAWGPGKYDAEATHVREVTHARGVIMIVFDGDRGTGFSAQLDVTRLLGIPHILRDIADQIEKSGPVA